MIIGGKNPRDFSYIHHKDTYPLELKGNLKGKNQNTVKKQLSNNLGITPEMRQKLLRKIDQNYHDYKCIIPASFQEQKKESIKTYHHQRHAGLSGVPYLSIKSNQSILKQRKHLNQNSISKRPRSSCERRHYRGSQFCTSEYEHPRQNQFTHEVKIHNDLHSSVYRKEEERISKVKAGDRHLFCEGEKLGFQDKKEKRLSKHKMCELVGQYDMGKQKNQSRVFRDDWRRSSFTLG